MNEGEDTLLVAVMLTESETELLSLILGMGAGRYLDLMPSYDKERRDGEMIRLAEMSNKMLAAIGEAKK